jgi:hypothetical protein
VRTEADVARTRQIESARMSWCLGDVKRLHGNAGLENRFDDWTNDETTVVYPDGPPAETLPQPPEQSTGVTLEPAPLPITPQSGQMPIESMPPVPVPTEGSAAPPAPTGARVTAAAPPPLFDPPDASTVRLQPAASPGGAP